MQVYNLNVTSPNSSKIFFYEINNDKYNVSKDKNNW